MADAVQQLIEAMQQELQNQKDLSAVLNHKLDAMRNYDISKLESLSQSEQRLLDGIGINEIKRVEAARRVGMNLSPGKLGESLTVSKLAEAAGEPTRTKLVSLAAMLRDVAENVSRLNRINAIASEKVLGHFDQIFQIIAQSGRDIGLYGRYGKKSFLEQNRLVDAVG